MKSITITSIGQKKGKLTIGYIAHSRDEDHEMTIVFDDNLHDIPAKPLEQLNTAWRKLAVFGLHSVGCISSRRAKESQDFWRDGVVNNDFANWNDSVQGRVEFRGIKWGDIAEEPQAVRLILGYIPESDVNASHSIQTAWLSLCEIQPKGYHLTQFWEFMAELSNEIQGAICEILTSTIKKQTNQLDLFESSHGKKEFLFGESAKG